MADVNWTNGAQTTVTWVAVKGDTSQQGPLKPMGLKTLDRSVVGFAGWSLSNFTGQVLVSIPGSSEDPVSVLISTPKLEGDGNELKAGE